MFIWCHNGRQDGFGIVALLGGRRLFVFNFAGFRQGSQVFRPFFELDQFFFVQFLHDLTDFAQGGHVHGKLRPELCHARLDAFHLLLMLGNVRLEIASTLTNLDGSLFKFESNRGGAVNSSSIITQRVGRVTTLWILICSDGFLLLE